MVNMMADQQMQVKLLSCGKLAGNQVSSESTLRKIGAKKSIW